MKKPGRVKSALLSWLGVPVTLMDEDFWRAFAANGPSRAGQNVSQDSVLSLSATWACVRLISETVGTLPLKLYERTSDGRREAAEHPVYHMLHRQPNLRSSAASHWEATEAAIQLRGNAFSERLTIGNRLVGLRFLHPNRLTLKDQADDGSYRLNYSEGRGRQRTISSANLFHIPGFSLDGRMGLSTIQYGASVFGSALAASGAANSTFEKGLMPTVALTMDRILKKEQRTEFRDNVAQIAGAINAGETALLEGGMDAKTIGINPSDAQLLESRGFSVEEVCRWFRVDPSMVGHGNKDSNWGTGLEQKLIAFLTFTMRPSLTRIEQAINQQLLTPAEQLRYYAEFNIDALLRADSAARAAFYSVMANNGIITRDEIRVKENLPPMGGNAAVLTVQSAMVPLDTIGQQRDGDTARAALAGWLQPYIQQSESDA